jgi:hypothetical protein
VNGAGYAASTNSGSGGGGGGGNSNSNTSAGTGGGAGGYVEAYVSTPAASYAYTVGAGGAGGAAGVFAGGGGGSGIIIVEENYAVNASGAESNITRGTAVATTSGTSIDFTSIPSWVKRITVMFSGVSTSGTSNYLMQLGSGSFTTSGYVSTATYGGPSASGTTSTAGFLLTFASSATDSFRGNIIITNISGNIWVYSSLLARSDTYVWVGGGSLTLAGVLDRIRLTTVNGTDTFDAGSVNILYE